MIRDATHYCQNGALALHGFEMSDRPNCENDVNICSKVSVVGLATMAQEYARNFIQWIVVILDV